MSDEEKEGQRFTPVASETFDETPGARQEVSAVDASDGHRLVGLSKVAKVVDKKTGESKEVRTRKKYFVPIEKLNPLMEALKRLARKIGWRVEETDAERKIGELLSKINEISQALTRLEAEKTLTEQGRKALESQLEEAKKQVVSTNLPRFKADLDSLDRLLSRSPSEIGEEDIQKFLKERPWMFGLEFLRADPKSPASSKSIFDFYLLDYEKHGVIIELKLPAEKVFGSEEYALSTKVAEGLGQLIRYLETTQAIAQSSMMREVEGKTETKPRGFLVIGRLSEQGASEKLHVVNSYFHGIQVLTYDDVLDKAKTSIANIVGTQPQVQQPPVMVSPQ